MINSQSWNTIFQNQRQNRGLLQDLWDSLEGHRLLFQKVVKC